MDKMSRRSRQGLMEVNLTLSGVSRRSRQGIKLSSVSGHSCVIERKTHGDDRQTE